MDQANVNATLTVAVPSENPRIATGSSAHDGALG
jgi:hypothetical protein